MWRTTLIQQYSTCLARLSYHIRLQISTAMIWSSHLISLVFGVIELKTSAGCGNMLLSPPSRNCPCIVIFLPIIIAHPFIKNRWKGMRSGYFLQKEEYEGFFVKSAEYKKKTSETRRFQRRWSCYPDSNWRPHPYQLWESCGGLLFVDVACCPQNVAVQGIAGISLRCLSCAADAWNSLFFGGRMGF